MGTLVMVGGSNPVVSHSYLNCRVRHYYSRPLDLLFYHLKPQVNYFGIEFREPLHHTVHACTIAGITSLLNYLESTSPGTITGTTSFD